ncbi:hypothetical protein M1614_02270 [Candidatus Marsarchaeota archaeon]|jgi:translation elongation factor EF-1beta|nr:hypothetical protein [Candidatus Marsarchaeota archaeon]MCL5090142.1 hypothetical protein [Candidatus Marsarchaeota archaeon]
MSEVSIIFKVYPAEGNIEELIQEINKLKPKDIKTEEIGFGIKIAKVMFVFDDTKTSSSKIEEMLKNSKGVGEVEVEEESLL